MRVVQKYGGTSVADPERMRSVAEQIARTHRRGDEVVVVVSAMGKMYARTKTAPDPAAARQMLYRASRKYDEGTWRSADTKGLDIPDIAYTWLKDLKD